jgi:hypothetical protein
MAARSFGFHTNITGSVAKFFDFTVNTNPVITLFDKGKGNTLDLSGFTEAVNGRPDGRRIQQCRRAGQTISASPSAP